MQPEQADPPDDPWYPLAGRIRSERIGRGWSAKQLADQVGCSRATIHNWEAGKPIPLERTALLAAALGLEPRTLLALHPHAAPPAAVNVAPPPAASPPPATTTRWWRHRGVVAGGSAAVIVVGTMFATWLTATAGCFEVGAGGGSMIGPFRSAYDTYGGRVVLGCAANEVHKWGPGYVQDLEGGSAGRSSLMTLNRTDVYVLAGPLWWDYVAVAGGATTDFAGLAASPPLRCGPSVLVLLDGGLDGPGALVESDSGSFVWVPADFWAQYRAAGGPAGPLGRPLADGVTRDSSGPTLLFEAGKMTKSYGGPVEGASGIDATPFDLSRCTPADLEAISLGDPPPG